MNSTGLFFGTETGTIRLIANKIQKKLDDHIASKPLNINRITPTEILPYPKRFASSPMRLYEVFQGYGAELDGSWSTDGYASGNAVRLYSE